MLRTSLFFVVLLVVFFAASPVSSCSPSSLNCAVSDWASWSVCSKKCSIGTRSRLRTIIVYPAFGGSSCPSLMQTESCGSINGGCEDICYESSGTCACTGSGYKLADDGKSCVDKDER